MTVKINKTATGERAVAVEYTPCNLMSRRTTRIKSIRTGDASDDGLVLEHECDSFLWN